MEEGIMANKQWFSQVRSMADETIDKKFLEPETVELYNQELGMQQSLRKHYTRKAATLFLAGTAYFTIDYLTEGWLTRNLTVLAPLAAICSVALSVPNGMSAVDAYKKERFMKNEYERVEQSIGVSL
jgi:hypothetical protein